ncbi:hypothetical protein J8273_6304 [Carpediemonas membranifera]|uniref:Uncharacterized protein n=1 Tax=Carpediemonas membranifera TaxID=201153 RepID=A0A8J6E882_9EUKA|nr:hypothetical protein J8273_6304 [Carpediemonas membranifera]|eukprot:KAG9391540.1 hypothetical protein J8273_6304 [Carpediemonas membranifera]
MGNRLPFLPAEEDANTSNEALSPSIVMCDASIQAIDDTATKEPSPEPVPDEVEEYRPVRTPSRTRSRSAGPRRAPKRQGFGTDWTFPRLGDSNRESIQMRRKSLSTAHRVDSLAATAAREMSESMRVRGRTPIKENELQVLRERHRLISSALESIRADQERIARQRQHEKDQREMRASVMEQNSCVKRHFAPDKDVRLKKLMTPPLRYRTRPLSRPISRGGDYEPSESMNETQAKTAVHTGPRAGRENERAERHGATTRPRPLSRQMSRASSAQHSRARLSQVESYLDRPERPESLTVSQFAPEPMLVSAAAVKASEPAVPDGFESTDALMQELMEADRQWRAMTRNLKL